MQEGGERALFVEAVLRGKTQSVDAAQLAVRRIAHGALNSGNAVAVGRLPQHVKQGFSIAHSEVSRVLRALKCDTSK